MLILEIGDAIYQVGLNVSIITNIQYIIKLIIITTFQTTGLELIFYDWLPCCRSSVKNFQNDQLNSRRFQVFPEVVYTLWKRTYDD